MRFMSKKQQSDVPRRRQASATDGPTRATPAELDTRYAFQRNRTLTGSLASGVASVNEHKAELKSPRVHAHHLRRHRRNAFGALVAVLLAAAGLYVLVTQSIVSVTVTSANSVGQDASLYQSKIHDYLAVRPLERFRFSLNTASLTTYLVAHDAPEVAQVDSTVSANGLGKAAIHLTFRNPVVVWQTGSTRLYVDAAGNTFTRNHFSEPGVQVVDQTGIQAQNNQVLASDRFLAFIGRVIGRMKDNGLTVTDIILPANTTRQVQVKVAGVSYPVKFSVDRPEGEQAEDAARSIRYLLAKGISAQYIDVRVSGKAYYQ